MSKNGPYPGPPWSGGSSDEPYTEPVDPWGDHGTDQAEWGAPAPGPPQPAGYHAVLAGGSPTWQPPPPKRNRPVILLVVGLAVLVCIGLATTIWLLTRGPGQPVKPQATASTAANPGPAPQGSDDARYSVAEGDCVINQGSDVLPDVRTTGCTSGTYVVLKRIDGKTSGEKDAESKCAKVRGYTKWYYYDSPMDDFDFVLCLKEYTDQ